MMTALSNAKREAFCQHRAVGSKTLDEAYVLAGYKPNRKNAARLAMTKEVKARLKELQAHAAEVVDVTVEMMAVQFDEDRRLAIKMKQMGAAHSASVSKAKLFGLFVDRSVVNVSHSYSTMSEEEIRFELAALAAEARALKPGVQH
jgi:hypothetical protein